MGIRALGFLPLKPTDDQTSLMQGLKTELTRLGAFGFEQWQCAIKSLIPGKDRSGDRDVKLITLSDTESMIAIHGDVCLTGDQAFHQQLTQSFGLRDSGRSVVIQGGYMAQLGDFKIRYGLISLNKQNRIVFDIEYLPVQLLSSDFSMLFTSVLKMMTQREIKLYPPKVAPGETYSFASLGIEYLRLVEEASK